MPNEFNTFTELLSYEEARACLRRKAYRLHVVKKPLSESVRYVLATDIYTAHDWPSFPYATANGYAVQAESTEGASDYFPLLLKDLPLSQEITAGSPVPAGADAVVGFHQCRQNVRGQWELVSPVAYGQNICSADSEIYAQDILLHKGDLLKERQINVLAQIGIKEIEVLPKIAFHFAEKQSSKIHAGAAYDILQGFLKKIGLCSRNEIYATQADLKKFIDLPRQETSVLILIGGSGDGDDDQTAFMLEQSGAKKLFHGVGLQECTYFGLYEINAKLVFLVPSAPRAAMAAYVAFFVPFLQICYAEPSCFSLSYGACTRKIISPVGLASFVAVQDQKEGNLMPLYGQEETWLKANGGFIVPSAHEGYTAGSEISYYTF